MSHPDQWSSANPASGSAVRTAAVARGKLSLQSMPHRMPGGVLATDPPALLLTVSGKCSGTKVAVQVRASVIETAIDAAVPSHPEPLHSTKLDPGAGSATSVMGTVASSSSGPTP